MILFLIRYNLNKKFNKLYLHINYKKKLFKLLEFVIVLKSTQMNL